MTLFDLATRYRSDKAGDRQLLWAYEACLAPHRESMRAVIEFGVLDGASLRMWRDYFPNAHVYGVDSDPSAREYEDDRIDVIIGYQTDATVLDQLVGVAGRPDLVVDDASHLARDQTGTLTYLWRHVNPGGFYIVEDTHTSYLAEYGMGWRQPGSTIDFLKGIVDDVHEHWHDRPVLFRDVLTIEFVSEACIIRKRPEAA